MLVVAVRLPDLPVIVTAALPAVAELAVAIFTALLPDVIAPKVTVTPFGRPDADSVTAPVKPDISVMAMLLVPVDPRVTVKVAGVAARVNPGGGLTVRATVALLLSAPDVPVTVMMDVPAGALLAAERVSVLMADFTALKVAVTPLGRPDAASATVPLKPKRLVMAMVLAPLAPGVTLNAVGVAARVKAGCGAIVSAIVTFAVRLPDVPVIVTVAVPANAVDAALNVAVLLRAPMEMNVTVTPGGKPVAASATAPVKPFCGAMAMVLTRVAA